jgi:dGTP triphosphohydrolase
MRTLTQLQQNRRVIQDFTLTTLAGIPGLFARLTYIASLRDLSSGRYEHAGLAALYPDAAIQQAMQLCHEQIFERILEAPLSSQEQDLRACLARMEDGLSVAVSHWRRMEAYRVLVPEAAPEYLKDLFCSNLRVLLEILDEERSPARSSA